jgi:hypothetical protein
MGRILLIGFVSLLVGAGCAPPSKTIDTPGVLAALKSAGLRNLAVTSSNDSSSRDYSFIRTRGYSGWEVVEMPISALRASSISTAKTRLSNDQPLLQHNLSPAERRLLRRDFDVTRLKEVRVCNVVVTSYNGRNDASLAARFKRAISMLRSRCS